jgi:hypothetical protein
VVLDQRSGAERVRIVPWRLRRGATLEVALGGRLRLSSPLLRRDWHLRDEGGSSVLRVTSRPRDARRLRFVGEPQAGLDIATVLAVAFAVLVSDDLAVLARAGGGGGDGA